jgi:predicted small secreted protein
MRPIALVLSLLLIAAGVSACSNTVNGFGQDVEHAGHSIQKSVQ